jgi:predicted RNase H-like HicB family nuclease
MQFEVEIYRNETGEWVATAVEYAVSVTGRTEAEALSRVMDALTLHFKTADKQSARKRPKPAER